MTQVEAKELLKQRVEWDNSLDTRFNFLTFTTPESGRFLQEEHEATVNIPLIYDTVAISGIANDDFQDYLKKIKEEGILQMLHDVFSETKEIESLIVSNNLGLFDYAIILKVTINVMSKVLNSSRIGMQETIVKENLNKYYIDLNGMNNPDNGVFVTGFIERYRMEIKRIKQSLSVRRRLRVITAI